MEVTARHLVGDRTDIEFASAGTHGFTSHALNPEMAAVLADRRRRTRLRAAAALTGDLIERGRPGAHRRGHAPQLPARGAPPGVPQGLHARPVRARPQRAARPAGRELLDGGRAAARRRRTPSTTSTTPTGAGHEAARPTAAASDHRAMLERRRLRALTGEDPMADLAHRHLLLHPGGRLLRRHRRRPDRHGRRRPDDAGADLPRRRRRRDRRHRRPHRGRGLQDRRRDRAQARGLAQHAAGQVADHRLGADGAARAPPGRVRSPTPRTSTTSLKLCIGFALLLAAATYALRLYINLRRVRSGRPRARRRTRTIRPIPTLLVGALGGLLVGITSVGSGSVIMIALLMLYPGLSAVRLVGTDLVQAVPLVLAAAISNIALHGLDWDDPDPARPRLGARAPCSAARSPRGCRSRSSAAASSSC